MGERCRRCDEELPARAKFCADCGHPVAAAYPGVVTESATVTEAAQKLLPPRLIAAGTRITERYQIDGVIGEGGMGVVYRAVDLRARARRSRSRRCTSSLMGDAEIRRRFTREAQLMLGWNHRHVARVHELHRAPRPARVRHGVRRGSDARGARAALGRQAAVRRHPPDLHRRPRGDGRGALGRHHPSRPQAAEHPAPARRQRRASRRSSTSASRRSSRARRTR